MIVHGASYQMLAGALWFPDFCGSGDGEQGKSKIN